MNGPLPRYRELAARADLDHDPAQEAAAIRLQALHDALTAPRPRLFAPKEAAPRGVYLWGGVGRGKSLLMDVFFNNTAVDAKMRAHFHEFMAETHAQIAGFRALSAAARRRTPGVNARAPDDPMPPVAEAVARRARLLCLDEFQVNDIADASILSRLFSALFARGVILVATSNRRPDDLYLDGQNRDLFLPFIALLKERLDVVELVAARDYRLARLQGAPTYYAPLGPAADAAMDAAWRGAISGARERQESVVVLGRSIGVPRAARGSARLTFDALCAAALGASDYRALAARYSALFIDRIPLLTPEQRNEARRFVMLIDCLYEAKTKLVCSAAAEPEGLYPAGDGAFEFARTVSRLHEMRSADYLGAEHHARIDAPR